MRNVRAKIIIDIECIGVDEEFTDETLKFCIEQDIQNFDKWDYVLHSIEKLEGEDG